MMLHSFLSKSRKKILRMLLGENSYSMVERINTRGLWYLMQKYAPESKYPELLSDWYFEAIGEKLNLENPRTYTEKIQWLKLHDSTPVKTRLSDKYLVRQWITEKIGAEHLVPLLGVWNCFDDINFEILPDRFVLKANHGSGWVKIVKNKSKFKKTEAKRDFDIWINTNFAYCAGLELQYRDIEPKIIAEQYLEDDSGALADYKFYCFDGTPYAVRYFENRFDKNGFKDIVYNLNWEPAGWSMTRHKPCTGIKKPENFDEMLHLVKILCAGFNHVRVDLYAVGEKVYFGEMTFTPSSGIYYFKPEEWNRKLGDMIKLPIDNTSN